MGSATIDQRPGGTVVVRGALQLDTVSSLLKGIDFNRARGQEILIDLSDVESVDSAGLALCLEWISMAQRKVVTVSFKGVPEQMRRLADLNQVGDLFAEPS